MKYILFLAFLVASVNGTNYTTTDFYLNFRTANDIAQGTPNTNKVSGSISIVDNTISASFAESADNGGTVTGVTYTSASGTCTDATHCTLEVTRKKGVQYPSPMKMDYELTTDSDGLVTFTVLNGDGQTQAGYPQTSGPYNTVFVVLEGTASVDFEADPPDEFIFVDPGTVDVSEWSLASSSCTAANTYAIIKEDGSGFDCVTCGHTDFYERFSVGHNLKIVTVSSIKVMAIDDTSASAKKATHGICCVNPHHSVCEALVDEYKLKCENANKGTSEVCAA